MLGYTVSSRAMLSIISARYAYPILIGLGLEALEHQIFFPYSLRVINSDIDTDKHSKR